MIRKLLPLIAIFILGAAAVPSVLGMAAAVYPANGLPNSVEFGYGAWVHANGGSPETAINTAKNLNLDWIALELNWAAQWPDPSLSPDLGALANTLNLANQQRIPVMLSIHTPPAWVMTAQGPNADVLSNFLVQLVQAYPSIHAIEVLPGANTIAGWGTMPNATSYTALFQNVHQQITQLNLGITLIAAGLQTPVQAGDITETDFLRQLYATGIKPIMPIVSVQLDQIQGDVLDYPSPDNPFVLRRYENIRMVMMQNQHPEGLLWVTRFSWPDMLQANPAQQANWLFSSYQMMSAQLYIGTAVFDSLNPSPNAQGMSSLILPDQTQHPALQRYLDITSVSGGEMTSLQTTYKRIQTNKGRFRP